MKQLLLLSSVIFCLLIQVSTEAQSFYNETPAAKRWVKRKFKRLSDDEKIAQLMIVRAHSNLGPEHVASVVELIKKYNVGGLCFFQGGPVRQAVLTNYYQKIAKTPLMVSIDGEWGLGMRLDSVINYPRQLMMGAVPDADLIYEFGKAVGEQCKRIGIQVNFAPDVDVNNNPQNPVINDRSFGEDKYKVALYGIQYMKGMEASRVLASAKHFPGHGDVAVDSHKDLPIIYKTRQQLDELELYPFREMIKAGVGSIMVAHLSIPSIDTTANLPTSLSPKTINGLLRTELGYKGISFTDALEMQGVAKFFPKGEASARSLIAGNDLLCLPGDVPGSIAAVKQAIADGKLTWEDINEKVKKVLLVKYNLGLNHVSKIDTTNLLNDLNEKTNHIKELLAKNAITLLKKSNANLLPLTVKKVAYLGVGLEKSNEFASRLLLDFKADVFLFSNKDAATKTDSIMQVLATYDAVVIGIHNYSRRPAGNYGLSDNTIELLKKVQKFNAINFVFGNPYALKYVCTAKNLVACYEDDAITQNAAADLLKGKWDAKGKLPVTVCDELQVGNGIVYNQFLPEASPASVGLSEETLQKIDAIATNGIAKGAMPGCVVLVAKDGKIAYNKAFGYTNFDRKEPINTEMIYDLASVTKVSATTVSIMKLYEEGKIDLNKTLGDYLPWVKGSDKAAITLKEVLLHQAGLKEFIPFYRAVIDTVTGIPNPAYFSKLKDNKHQFRVAEDLYVRNDYEDSLYQRILDSKLMPAGHYIYSDNDFIFLGKVVEAVSGLPLNDYARVNFYEPLQMTTTGFKPRERLPLGNIVPTEEEKHFRQQLIRGDVHDEGAAMFGGVAGHAGLFSNAYDLAKLYQMLLNGGELNGIRLLKKETIDLFTAYNSDVSRRGLGFDKPEKDNATRKIPYPSASVSLETFGHTGFTGTCVWVDPKQKLVYIFLSNRVTPTRDNNKLGQMNIRPTIQEAVYQSILK